jgi:recombination protein RecR
MKYPNSLIQLIRELSRLPGVGPKGAQRLAFHLFKIPHEDVESLAEAITTAKALLKPCPICSNITDEEVCAVCSDLERDPYLICVVESPNDIIAIEKAGGFMGRYHVTHGVYSPMDGVGPERLGLDKLLARLQRDVRTGEVLDPSRFEVVVATSMTTEGEATASLVHHQVSALGATVSRLAYGLPNGAALEYMDEVTLGRAFNGRQRI